MRQCGFPQPIDMFQLEKIVKNLTQSKQLTGIRISGYGDQTIYNQIFTP